MAARPQDYFDEEILGMGGHIYALPKFRGKNYGAYKKAIRAFFETHGGWAAIEGHMTSTASLYLPIAKACGVPVTLSHLRSAGVQKGMKGLATNMLRASLPRKADVLLSCSRYAGEKVYGAKAARAGRIKVIPNAIETASLKFDPDARNEIRKAYGIPEDAYVIGHVGRFDPMKNHVFLVSILEHLAGSDLDYRMLLVGKGNLRPEIEAALEKLGLQDKVVFAGECDRRKTAQIYQAFDCFAFPSLYEGVPGTVVEAQSSAFPACCRIASPMRYA